MFAQLTRERRAIYDAQKILDNRYDAKQISEEEYLKHNARLDDKLTRLNRAAVQSFILE